MIHLFIYSIMLIIPLSVEHCSSDMNSGFNFEGDKGSFILKLESSLYLPSLCSALRINFWLLLMRGRE